MLTLKPLVAAVAILGGVFASLTAQNVTLVKQWKRTGATYFNDIWGYTAPTGEEIAVIGEKQGIWIVDCTDPKNIKQIAWWSAPDSYWRDFTNVGPYVYAATENASQRGFRVIDLTKPGSPVDLGYVQTGTMVSAHNVSADPATGLIYFSGSNQGVAIYDTTSNPKNPSLVGTWTTNYVHDICARRGKAYFSSGGTRACKIMNTSNPKALTLIGQCNTPGGYSHNAWVSEDDKVLCCTDELGRGSVSPHMTVWDISNPASPVKKGDYDLGNSYIAHNVFVIGRTAYMSHYNDGIHVIDLADLTKPTQIARYDTSTQPTGYDGAWGVYPFADHGLVYGSDTDNGLFVLQVDCGHMNRYGTGTAGTNGVPRARFDGASPKVGASGLQMDIENLEPSKGFWVAISGNAGSTTVLGAQVNIDLTVVQLVGPFAADAKGEATVAAPVPNDAALGGAKIYIQIFGDRGNGTLVSSRGMWAGICK